MSAGAESGQEFARAADVTAIAAQIETLRRTLAVTTGTADAARDRVEGLPQRVEETSGRVGTVDGRVDDLARLVGQLAESVAALSARPKADPAPSWLMLPADTASAAEVLDELAGWMRAIYLRYADAAIGLPECWCWHPDVVEELLWLMHAWLAAYQGPKASVSGAADWHDRHRPGVVRRISQGAGTCSRERHQVRPGWPTAPSGAPEVPGEADLGRIAEWWGPRRDDTAPEPPTAGPHRIGPPAGGWR